MNIWSIVLAAVLFEAIAAYQDVIENHYHISGSQRPHQGRWHEPSGHFPHQNPNAFSQFHHNQGYLPPHGGPPHHARLPHSGFHHYPPHQGSYLGRYKSPHHYGVYGHHHGYLPPHSGAHNHIQNSQSHIPSRFTGGNGEEGETNNGGGNEADNNENEGGATIDERFGNENEGRPINYQSPISAFVPKVSQLLLHNALSGNLLQNLLPSSSNDAESE